MKKLPEARPGLISEASDTQGYTGLAWAEHGVVEGRVECRLVVEYLKLKKREEGLYKKLMVLDDLCMWCKDGLLRIEEFEKLKQELLLLTT